MTWLLLLLATAINWATFNIFENILKTIFESCPIENCPAVLAELLFGTTCKARALKTHYFWWLFYERIHKVAQYVSILQTCETWVKHRRQECSTSICGYNYDLLCHFITKNVRTPHILRHESGSRSFYMYCAYDHCDERPPVI